MTTDFGFFFSAGFARSELLFIFVYVRDVRGATATMAVDFAEYKNYVCARAH